ncbi:ABC-F family ATP-binding cassette domain-containing protein [Asticcacaulis sp. 201]|uniref:ABC-F family ATP-binding cassette domain-containing protein n=1 Tax=Asticcacaulis sp. 201 TaxID=3028787 RepID=UPI002916C0E7|nr:ABC-F family ATP-binding cassette domain-containing protein [Asticcacaulis sp. 201]MDV6331823.1 ABC-F family ATP-binding cassette domain-containing protein [Asticcacaulis sp. 201]
MSAIILSDLSWSAPDGRALFSSLNLTFGPERTGIVGRNGVGKSTLLRLISGDLTAAAGYVSCSGTLGVLRQTVQVDPNETVADLFGVGAARAILRRAEAGEATLDDLADADWTLETRMIEALAYLGLDTDADTRLAALSGGQRTRAGLAALVFQAPDFLLLDEPTNTLDRDGRQAVFDLLTSWKKGAVVVSHDRELLEIMDSIVELTALGATRYGGNWSQYRARKAQDLAAAQADLADAEKRAADVVRNAQTTAERKARKDGAGQRKAARGDAPKILLGGLKNRSENTGGDAARLAERQRTEALEAAAEARRRIEILQPLSVTLPPTRLPPGRSVVKLDSVIVGYAPNRPIIRDLSFAVTGPERVAITGANGTGKTTLLSVISGRLIPWSGAVRVTPDRALLDQSVSLLDPTVSIRENFHRLHPDTDENACRAALARFMFRADAALQNTGTLSGGQLLRAGLACVTGGTSAPSLLVLDEPTNHLDIDSIAAVEAGLRAYDGALIVVSHDETFLEAIGLTRRLILT